MSRTTLKDAPKFERYAQLFADIVGQKLPLIVNQEYQQEFCLYMDSWLNTLFWSHDESYKGPTCRYMHKVIRVRYGLLTNASAQTLEETGKLVRRRFPERYYQGRAGTHVSKERVRQLVAGGIRRLRHPSRCDVWPAAIYLLLFEVARELK